MERLAGERRAQSLPAHVIDPVALARVVELIARHEGRGKEAVRRPRAPHREAA